jgi:cytochrome bd ubiquinol oxidase subunit II
MPLDYETLRLIWWALLGILLIGFAVTDGFDLGVAMLLPWLGKNDLERRVIINCIGPTWEGNQVWFVLGGGAIFAAWPPLYSMAFSGFYLAMLLVLLALILRPVGFKYRSKLPNPTWRNMWDSALFIGGFIPALIFGVAMGNVLQGVPFHFDESLRAFYTGQFIQLLNPFALLAGLLSVTMLAMHGACFLNIKTENPIQHRARMSSIVMAFFSLLLFIGGGLWLYYGNFTGYSLDPSFTHNGPSNPLYKTVTLAPLGLFKNYDLYPISRFVPSLGIAGLVGVILFNKLPRIAFIFGGLGITGIIGTVGISIFPFLLPSSSHPSHSILVWDSSSSQLTLFIMLIATTIFLPIILAYTTWVYYMLRGKVTTQHIKKHDHTAY